jgi:cell division protein FtsL
MRGLVMQLRGQNLLMLVLVTSVLLSGMAVVYAKYESRKLFSEMEKLRLQRDDMVVDWGRLQIELATWSENSRIQEKAIEKLGMQMPAMSNVVVIKDQ